MIEAVTLLVLQAVPIVPQSVLPHGAPVEKVAVDAKGEYIFTAARTGENETFELRRWDLDKKEELWKTKVHSGTPHSLFATNKFLHIGNPGASMCNYVIWRTVKSACRRVGPTQEFRLHRSWGESDDAWVWIGTPKGIIRLTPGEVKGWKTRSTDDVGVTSLALAPNDKDLAIGGKDGSIRWAHAGNASVKNKLTKGHTGAVTHLVFGQKGKLLVSSSEDGTVRLWSSMGKKRLEISAKQLGQNKVESIFCDPRGAWVAAALSDRTIRFYDTKKRPASHSIGGQRVGSELRHGSYRQG